MTEVIENGDYVLEDGKLKTAEYTETILQDIARAVYTKKGSFYPEALYGSKLRVDGERQGAAYAVSFAREALADMDGVYVESAQETDSGYDFTIYINNEKRQVSVSV